jgi:PAS domain S-box-containing protein
MSKERFEELRRKAEEQLCEREGRIKSLERADLEELAHELAVHQVELEIQNEELRRTRLEAEEARDRYMDLFDFAPVGYFTLDEHNRIVEANLTGCQLLKTERNNILKNSFTKFIQSDESEKFYLQRRKVLESGTKQTGELQMQTAEGTPFYAQIEILKAGAERLRLAVIDVTERRKLAETLAHQNIDLEVVNKELEAFSSSVSHDLRAPLRRIDGFCRALLEDCADKLDTQEKDYLQRIHQSVEKMGELIEGLLSLSQVARQDVLLKAVNLSEIARDIITEIKKVQPERKVEFTIAPGIEAYGDARLLRIVLENLLNNAWKFTSKVEKAKIEFGTVQRDGKLTYFVSDNGAGFNMKYADKLFQPFQRLHTATDFAGTGIGLATVQRIIHRHGGRIWAEGEVGKGAMFYFTLD